MMRLKIFVLMIICFVFSSLQAQIAYEHICNNFSVHQSSTQMTVIASHPSTNLLAVGGQGGIEIYAMPEFEILSQLVIPREENTAFHNVEGITWSPNADFIAASVTYASLSSFNETIVQPHLIIWDLATQSARTIFSATEEPYMERAILEWSPDGNWLAALMIRLGKMQVWDIYSDTLAFEYQATTQTEFIGRLAWSANSSELLFANDANVRIGSSEKASLLAFDVMNNWELLRTIEMPFWELKDMAYSSQSELAIAGGAIFIWDTSTWELSSEIFDPTHRHDLLQWSSDGQYLLTAGHYEGTYGLNFYENDSANFTTFLDFPYQISQIELSNDNQYIYTLALESDFVTGTFANSIAIWDIANECLVAVVEPAE